jgi:chemotaxis signal transduction protein
VTQAGELQGAIAVRDEVISIAKLGDSKEFDSVVIMESDCKKVAILVDEVFDIESFDTLKIERLEDKSVAINAFYNFKNSVVAIINPEYFVQHIEAKDEAQLDEDHNASLREEFLTFRIQNKRFAIDMKSVRQVVETEMLSKTESSSIIANSHIKFITTWNKMAISVADISHLVGVEEFDVENSQTLFIQNEDHHLAFLVDEVEDIVYLSDHEVKTASQNDSIIGGAVLVDDDVLVKINEHFLVSMC